MNKFYVTIIFILSLCLSSCSMPITFLVLNNSQSDIVVTSGEDSIIISPQDAEKIKSLGYGFVITTNDQGLKYNVQDIDLNHVHWTGWGPFSKRMFYVQFEGSYEIYVLSQETNKPVNEFITQPTGFPLIPNT